MRVVIADDTMLIRQGIAAVLTDAGIDVVASVGDPESLDTRLSHRISNVRAVMVCTDAAGRDTALRLDTVSGRCTITVSEES